MQQRGVRFDLLPVQRVVARVHDKTDQIKGDLAVPLQQLHQLRQKHGILPAGDADGDGVAGGDQLVALYGGDEGIPQPLSEFRLDAALHLLINFQLFHRTSSL